MEKKSVIPSKKTVITFLFILALGAVWAVTTITDDNVQTPNVLFGNTDGDQSETAANRPLTSNAATTINVPADYATIQEAVNQVPLVLRHQYIIQLADGTYAEDVYVPPTLTSGSSASEGSVERFRIRGNCTDYSNVKVSSFQISGSVGAISPFISCMEMTGVDPLSDENASITVYGSNEVQLGNLIFTGTTEFAVMAYASNVDLNDINLSGPNNGFFLKRMSVMNIGDNVSPGVFGSVSGDYVRVLSGFADLNPESINLTIGDDVVDCSTKSGFAKSGEVAYCIEEFQNQLQNMTIRNTNDNGTFFLRQTGYDQHLRIQVDDTNTVFFSEQDEDTSNNGGFQFNMDSEGTATPNFAIRSGSTLVQFSEDEGTRMFENNTGVTCNPGAFYYDGTLDKHRACNGTGWYDMY